MRLLSECVWRLCDVAVGAQWALLHHRMGGYMCFESQNVSQHSADQLDQSFFQICCVPKFSKMTDPRFKLTGKQPTSKTTCIKTKLYQQTM